MNTIKYDNTRGEFPLSTQALMFAQDISKMSYELARLGGGNYILRGCLNTTGNTWSEGIVVINGELLPFMGGTGTLASTIRVREEKDDVVAGYDTYEGVYTTRYVEFGSNVGNVETYNWSDFKQTKTLAEIVAEFATKAELSALNDLMMPKGGIIMWSGTIATIPNGYMLCNGNGGTAVNGLTIPDLRGRFIVGFDDSPTAATTPNNVVDEKTLNYGRVGNTGGKPLVTLKSNESGLPDFNVSIKHSSGGGTSGSMGIQNGTEDYGPYNHPVSGKDAATGHENRPPYYVLAYIIKVV